MPADPYTETELQAGCEAVLRTVAPRLDDVEVRAVLDAAAPLIAARVRAEVAEEIAVMVAEWQHPSNGVSEFYRQAVRKRLRDQWPQLADALDAIARAHATTEEDHRAA